MSGSQQDLQRALAAAARELDDDRNDREITQLAVGRAADAVHDGIAAEWQRVATMLRTRAAERASVPDLAWNEETEAERAADATLGHVFSGASGFLGGSVVAPRQADRYQVGRAPREPVGPTWDGTAPPDPDLDLDVPQDRDADWRR